jgi:hypothetical protein
MPPVASRRAVVGVSAVTIDGSTGCLVIDGRTVFPIVLSDPPPRGGKAPNGNDGWAEVASGGVNFIRSGRGDWNLQAIDQQIAAERVVLDEAATHGLHCWLRFADVANLPPPTGSLSANEQLLVRIADGLKGHPALGVWKGVDEPANPERPQRIPAAGLVRAYKRLKAVDPDHPLVITQAPLGPVAALLSYRPAFDISGADIYPVSYPPGVHSDLANKKISVVGDMTKKMVEAAGRKPIWMTLQIAWSGVLPRQQRPNLVPRFPTLQEERFMAYQAIVNVARGLVFFGGQLTQVLRPVDARVGWNWTFWQLVLRPLLVELTSTAVQPALVAAKAQAAVKATAADVELTTRQDGDFFYIIAVRRGGTTGQVTFSGLPRKHGGAPISGGQVLFEYRQEPLPPPIQPDKQVFRSLGAANNSFRDWFGPYDVHVYRFNLA